MKETKQTPSARQGSVSPCTGCSRPCNYTQCRPYRLWLNACWNRYRRWQDSPEPPDRYKPKSGQVWQYLSPVLLHDFVAEGPCKGCRWKTLCKDTHACSAYTAWTDLRWARLRKKFGVS